MALFQVNTHSITCLNLYHITPPFFHYNPYINFIYWYFVFLLSDGRSRSHLVLRRMLALVELDIPIISLAPISMLMLTAISTLLIPWFVSHYIIIGCFVSTTLRLHQIPPEGQLPITNARILNVHCCSDTPDHCYSIFVYFKCFLYNFLQFVVVMR